MRRRTYLHELRLDHGGGLVVVRVARPQQGVDLVDEDDAGLEMKFNSGLSFNFDLVDGNAGSGTTSKCT